MRSMDSDARSGMDSGAPLMESRGRKEVEEPLFIIQLHLHNITLSLSLSRFV